MNAERWQQIEELFHAALNSEPAQRTAFLARIRATDEALCSDVESLLASHEQTDSFFEESASALAAESTFGNSSAHVGPSSCFRNDTTFATNLDMRSLRVAARPAAAVRGLE